MSCEPPFLLNSYGDCSYCEDPCESCASDDESFCYECQYPYSWYANDYGECWICDEITCLLCDEYDHSMCYECIGGLVANNGTCESCPMHCEVCDSYYYPPICYDCYDGFTLDYEYGECIPCEPGCKYCSAEDSEVCE